MCKNIKQKILRIKELKSKTGLLTKKEIFELNSLIKELKELLRVKLQEQQDIDFIIDIY
ncbi:MAG: hypothetical protein J6569_00760 [Gilliamella sp.]|uniref:hypothetical protein n=1 Tax=Gilliamella TaxID=1193503 RepID=UPI0004620445|nr:MULTISPECIES: hypothetical protein [Gilliamella]KDN10017.1 hypothetical protein GAPWKB30_1357 [Gilliamella apicola]MCO6536721.1 hypothetical protein [Gilliamella sp.]MCO6538647.1 hypothetical protein [Gilliamella sp.]MCO6545902.1 hypothetical protein [Gilliamella sp.]MCO6548675.1 hypothetical protein [Gilliamella sp.]